MERNHTHLRSCCLPALAITLVLGYMLLAPLATHAISVYAEDFASPSSATWSFGNGVPIGASAFGVYTTGQHGARINGGRLEVTNRRGSSTSHGQGFAYVTCGGPGSVFDNSIYNSTLKENGSLVTWTFNMRKSHTANGGFSCSSTANQNNITTGLAFVLASSSAQGMQHSTNTCDPTGTAVGYAVVLGGSNATRLVRFENGLHNGAITNIAVASGFTHANYRSVRVTYDPATDVWTLEVRNDGGSAFSDPASGTYAAPISGVDATHVLVPLNFMGGYFQAGCIGNCSDPAYIAAFDNINVDVACVPPPATGPISGAALVCLGTTYTWTIQPVPGATSYIWTYSGTGATLNGATTNTVTVNFSGSATGGILSVAAVDDCPGPATTLEVAILPLPAAPGAIDGETAVCAGQQYTYSVPADPDVTFEWIFPPGWSVAGNTATVTVTAGSVGGSMLVRASNQCGTGPPSSLVLMLNPQPDVTLASPGLVCVDHPLFALTGGTPAGGSYTVDGAPATSFNPNVGVGAYALAYTYTDANGCTATATEVFIVDACASVEEWTMADFSLYPNPASDLLHVESTMALEAILVRDMAGRLVVSHHAPMWYGGRVTMSLDQCATGLHLVELVTADGQRHIARLVVAR